MVVFTLPEMKAFKRQMVENMIQDLKNELAVDQKKWETTKKMILDFDTNLESMEKFQKSKDFRGSKSPRKICERMRFCFLAEDFLNTQLRLAIVDDLSDKDKSDLKKIAGNQFHEMLALDEKRTRTLRQRFEKLTMIKKVADNEYKVFIAFWISNQLKNYVSALSNIFRSLYSSNNYEDFLIGRH